MGTDPQALRERFVEDFMSLLDEDTPDDVLEYFRAQAEAHARLLYGGEPEYVQHEGKLWGQSLTDHLLHGDSDED